MAFQANSNQASKTQQPLNNPPDEDRARPLIDEFGGEVILNRNGDLATIAAEGDSQVINLQARHFTRLEELHKEIDLTQSRLGRAALMRALINPPATFEAAIDNRCAIDELKSNSLLREALEEAIAKGQKKYFFSYGMEELALRFFSPEIADRAVENENVSFNIKRFIFKMLNNEREVMYAVKAVGALLKLFKDIPCAHSAIINKHLGVVRTLLASDEATILSGEARRYWSGVEDPRRLSWAIPSFAVHSRFINAESLVGHPVAMMPFWLAIGVNSRSLLQSYAYNQMPSMQSQLLVGVPMLFIMTRLFATTLKFVKPLRDRVCQISNLFQGLDAIGELDALLSLAKLPAKFGSSGCMPSLVARDRYSMSAENMHNPVLLLRGYSVPNSLELQGGRVKLFLGPNSGGKSTIVSTVFQNQILGQLGTAVAASNATMSIADKLIFQGPSFESLSEHGRFGSELRATKEAFLDATPRSLVILDEVGDGTTAEERTEIARAIIWGFSKIGSGTMLVTHNIALAERLESEQLAELYHLPLDGDKPTFRITPGISRHSNAERVARSLGFAPDDIERLISERGYE